jgi:hypothetical protein
LSVKRFLANKRIPVLDHPLYSPDFDPCDYFQFLKVKESLKGTRFETLEEVKEKTSNGKNVCNDVWNSGWTRGVY